MEVGIKPTSPGTPVWSHGGVVCTGETYKNVVKMTFAWKLGQREHRRCLKSPGIDEYLSALATFAHNRDQIGGRHSQLYAFHVQRRRF